MAFSLIEYTRFFPNFPLASGAGAGCFAAGSGADVGGFTGSGGSEPARSHRDCSRWIEGRKRSNETRFSGHLPRSSRSHAHVDHQLDEKGRWSRCRVAKVSLLICPFWFLAQLTFNLSLKYTTVTSNTILSSASSLFTFLVSLAFLGDLKSGLRTIASNPLLEDIFALLSTGLYAVSITLIRMKLPDSDGKSGEASTTQFLGYLGLFNVLIFLPVALILNITKMESFSSLTWKQLSLIISKGLLENVLSDYLWAKAVLPTSTTVATTGLTIQVPLTAIVDTLIGHAPDLIEMQNLVQLHIDKSIKLQ
ncbi:hypothetical protein V8G54_028701 [Vigna mungo]|uniref:Uncharacterized protein n=1 Tax=Vigna mungo TaxID=3915 RepID=A0AAQ3RLX8_VIGMU